MTEYPIGVYIALVLAIVFMAGPQACYNAGSWIGLILKAVWKAASAVFRMIVRSKGKPEVQILPLSASVSNATPFDRNVKGVPESKEGRTIDSVAEVF